MNVRSWYLDGVESFDDAEFERLHPRKHGRFIRKGFVSQEEDEKYLEAAKKNDIETCRKMLLSLAKKAIPNTFVKDEDGNPKIVYHGTPNFGFTKFDIEKTGKRTFDSYKVKGMYFSDNFFSAQSYTSNISKDVNVDSISSPRFEYWDEPVDEEDAYFYLSHILDKKNGGERIAEKIAFSENGGKILDFARKEWSERHSNFEKYKDEFFEKKDGVYGVFLNFEKPRIATSKGMVWTTVIELNGSEKDEIGHKDFVERAFANGNDGVIIKDTIDYASPPVGGFKPSTDYVAFSPLQIKSADPITIDDNGNVIPLSKRFQMNNPDIRY